MAPFPLRGSAVCSVLDWGERAGYTAADKATLNYIANYLRPGPSTKPDVRSYAFHVGGWPVYRSGEPPLDGDSDGMPDEWERKNGLNPGVADDKGDRDGDGYTNLEEYLNSL